MEILVWVVITGRACQRDRSEVCQDVVFQRLDIRGVLGLVYEVIDILLLIFECAVAYFLCLIIGQKFIRILPQCVLFDNFSHSHGTYLTIKILEDCNGHALLRKIAVFGKIKEPRK